MDHYGKIFKKIRESKGLSLSRISSISTSQLSRFEQGKTDLTLSRFVELLGEVNVTFEEFMYIANDFQRDELLEIIAVLKTASYARDILEIKKLIESQEKLYESTGNIRYKLQSIFIRIKLQDIEHSVLVTNDEIKFLTDYLFGVETWGYFELLLFGNTMDEMEHKTFMLLVKEVIGRTEFYRDLPNHKRLITKIVFNAYLTCVQNDELIDAKYFENQLEHFHFPETELFDRLLFNYGKSLYRYKCTGETEAIVEMRKCIDLLRTLGSKNLADWYERNMSQMIDEN